MWTAASHGTATAAATVQYRCTVATVLVQYCTLVVGIAALRMPVEMP